MDRRIRAFQRCFKVVVKNELGLGHLWTILDFLDREEVRVRALLHLVLARAEARVVPGIKKDQLFLPV